MHILANRIAIFIKKEPLLCALTVLSALLLASNVYQQGVVVNDELQWRFIRQSGYKNLIEAVRRVELFNGRAARIITPFLFAPTRDYYVNQTLSIACLLGNSLLFACCINKVFKDRYFAIFAGTISILALPLSFGHTPPESFVLHVGIPIFLGLLSLYLYATFLEIHRKIYLIFSLISFYLACSGFEFMLSIVPLYFMLSLYMEKNSTVKESLCFSGYFMVTAIMFCIVYFCLRIVYPSNYQGSQITISSVDSMIWVTWSLVKSSLPGYYLFSEKFLYLFNLYANNTATLHHSGEVASIIYHVSSFKGILSFGIVTILVFICQNKITENISSWKILGLLAAQLFLLPIPNSLSKQYQEWAFNGQCVGMPVNYPMFFISVIIFSILLLKLLTKFSSNRIIRLSIIFLCSLYISSIQSMNNVFANQEGANYRRLITIENIFGTYVMHTTYNKAPIYAPDLYRRMDALGIHKGYWTQYAQSRGLDVIVNSQSTYNDEPTMIFDEGNGRFTIVNGTHITAISASYINDDNIAVHTGIDSATTLNTKGQYQDNGLFILTKNRSSRN